MGCVDISDGAAIPRRSVSTMGLAALKISERCAHPFPTYGPAPRISLTPVFARGAKWAGSPKMGTRAADGAGPLGTALGWPLRATGGVRGLWRPNERARVHSGAASWCFESDLSVF